MLKISPSVICEEHTSISEYYILRTQRNAKYLSCRIARNTIALLWTTLLLLPAVGMEFRIDYSGYPAVYGEGLIVAGDADRMRPYLEQVPRDKFGMKQVRFNSPGGSVAAAFEVARLMDDNVVSTMIPPGASCASACGAILFLAGRIHLIAPNGRIGIHTCYSHQSRVPDDICNKEVAEFAVNHGVMWGSVYIFENATAPDDMLWFGMEEANCYGLLEWPDGMRPVGWNACVENAIKNLHCSPEQRNCRER